MYYYLDKYISGTINRKNSHCIFINSVSSFVIVFIQVEASGQLCVTGFAPVAGVLLCRAIFGCIQQWVLADVQPANSDAG